MNLRGARIHIAGSAANHVDLGLLRIANEFALEFSRQLGKKGAGIVVSASAEPLGADGIPLIFD